MSTGNSVKPGAMLKRKLGEILSPLLITPRTKRRRSEAAGPLTFLGFFSQVFLPYFIISQEHSEVSQGKG